MKIAIIGSGISGLTCAYHLNDKHDIQIFEANDYVGGHTRTVDVNVDGQPYAIDTGFIVFNDWTYPNFKRLMADINVPYQDTEMSFSVVDSHLKFEYSGSNLTSLFAQKRNCFSYSFWRMLANILRFNREALRDVERISSTLTLGQYLTQNKYSKRFISHYIVPMGAAIWSMPTQEMLNFPLQFFIRFFKNHGLLSINNRPQWHVIRGGSSAYIPALTAKFSDKILLNTPVQKVVRTANQVQVHTKNGSQTFDAVIFACHSNTALELIQTPSALEQELLGALPYADNDVVLHTDIRRLPARKAAWASWNYNLNANSRASLTYNMNILQGINSATTFCVSLNQTDLIDPSKILQRFTYAHPQFNLQGVAAQARWHEISGVGQTYFCGAYWGAGFHEDGVNSALRVVKQINA